MTATIKSVTIGAGTYEFSNKTAFAIRSDAERYAWAAFHVFVLLSSLIGDSLIFIAAIKYNAFKMNKLIVVTIKHIAASDLCKALFTVLPRIVALISNDQIFGTVLCNINAYFTYYFGTVSVF